VIRGIGVRIVRIILDLTTRRASQDQVPENFVMNVEGKKIKTNAENKNIKVSQNTNSMMV